MQWRWGAMGDTEWWLDPGSGSRSSLSSRVLLEMFIRKEIPTPLEKISYCSPGDYPWQWRCWDICVMMECKSVQWRPALIRLHTRLHLLHFNDICLLVLSTDYSRTRPWRTRQRNNTLNKRIALFFPLLPDSALALSAKDSCPFARL